jgi:hypothetical protein
MRKAQSQLTENGTRTNELTNQKESLGAALQHSTPPVQEASEPTPINRHRGMFRVWLLVSAGWIMGWTIYLLMHNLEGKFPGSDFFVVPILGPPVALLIFGIATRWAFWGFLVEDHARKE